MLNRLKSLFGSPKPASQSLYFKDAAAALKFASETLLYELRVGSGMPALVLDAKSEFGTDVPVAVSSDGIQTAVLRVCSSDGGFVVFAQTANAGGPRLSPGDLVIWLAGEQSRDLIHRVDDPRTAWVGLIVAALEPEYNPQTGWRIRAQYRR